MSSFQQCALKTADQICVEIHPVSIFFGNTRENTLYKWHTKTSQGCSNRKLNSETHREVDADIIIDLLDVSQSPMQLCHKSHVALVQLIHLTHHTASISSRCLFSCCRSYSNFLHVLPHPFLVHLHTFSSS